MERSTIQEGPTLAQYVGSILPEDLSTWERLFEWPPDVFFLTSSILKITGAYRHSVLPPDGSWPSIDDWDDKVGEEARAWREWLVGARDEMPAFLAERVRLLGSRMETPIARLGCLDGNAWRAPGSVRSEEATASWELCRALLEVHALADEACHGFGLPSGYFARKFEQLRPEMSAIDFQANMLLATTGTLARISRAHGVILPKMRTPQVGMTLRSLSHHVTYHQTEVQVIWRTLPWVNIDEDTINILVVPWPVDMKAAWFKPVPHFVRRRSAEPARYFSYSGAPEEMLIERILHLLEKAEGYAHRVHMMVFPELSLTHAELDAIKNLLARHRNRDSIPLLVAGLREEPEDRAQSTPARSGFNKIVLSTFFGGKWYDLCQHKHHRWRLEEFQIKQYSLGGVLGAKQDWWEAIDIPQRRLMFLAPNGWLTLCPLICEDLARQEPVSDLIRGVGPTLLLAILLDGPQLPARWPGRYANVLADDPGTSVLTVSSLGMANLAHPQRQPDQEGFVALWKDQLTNWGHIRLKKGQEAAVVTLAASWYEEFTADGRGDRKAAAVFSLLGYEPLDGATPEELAMKRQEPPNDEEPEEYDSGEESDVSELTTFSFLADAALDVPDHFVDNFAAWARGDVASDDWLEHGFRPGRTVLDRFRAKARSSNQEFPLFVDWLASFLKRVPLSTSEHGATPTGHGTDSGSRHERPRPTRYWTRLVDATEAALRDATVERFEERLLRNEEPGPDVPNVSLHEALRAEIYTALAVLWAVHRRLARQRQESGLTFETTNLLQRVETLLREPYDKQWYRARNLTAPDSRSAAAPDGG